ncbi:ETEC_3214 domain-containing protein [Streptomyces tanashiensis]|uniref:ETEC_3214 domain-containing protein n=1 Tax=Streptomyces tanashiensis TaxID=67367 RepID=UPI0033D2C471
MTTTSRWFRPRLLIGDTLVKLGKTRISALKEPDQFWSWLGARRFTYIESFYFGNPGGYRTWYVGVNDIGYEPTPPISMVEMADEEHKAFRSIARINTILVGTAFFQEASDASLFVNSFGPDQDQIRLLEPGMQLVHSRTAAWRSRFTIRRFAWYQNYRLWRYRKALERAQGSASKA